MESTSIGITQNVAIFFPYQIGILGLGSGFKIAMRDLEIRGAGSLLGAEQSGHIERIGYNLYVQLLNESVKELKGEKVENLTNVKVETNLRKDNPNRN